jgi:hypothetical protein
VRTTARCALLIFGVLISSEASRLEPSSQAKNMCSFVTFSQLNRSDPASWYWIIKIINKPTLMVVRLSEGKQIINTANNYWHNEPMFIFNADFDPLFVSKSVSRAGADL